jgi:hypothetical protein
MSRAGFGSQLGGVDPSEAGVECTVVDTVSTDLGLRGSGVSTVVVSPEVFPAKVFAGIR